MPHAQLGERLWRKLFPRRCANLRLRLESYRGYGLEIGGPSEIFNRAGIFPVYPVARRIDNCIFASETVWNQGHTDSRDLIAEATRLDFAKDASYDFVLSSHVLEHLANPLKALKEWRRVITDGGAMFIAVPNRLFTFDHSRSVTPFAHLVEDFEADRGENDLTHLPEILKLHDLQLDPGAGTYEQFRARSERNFYNRCLHQHVFASTTLVQALEWAGFKVLQVEEIAPHHIAATAAAIPVRSPPPIA